MTHRISVPDDETGYDIRLPVVKQNRITRAMHTLHDLYHRSEFPIPPILTKTAKARILLLGAGQVGKSTIFKQLKLVYDDQWEDWESWRQEASFTVRYTILHSMHFVLKNLDHDIIDSLDEITMRAAVRVAGINTEDFHNFDFNENIDDLRTLWTDPVIKNVILNYKQLWVPHCLSYFLDHLDRIWSSEYEGTKEDALNVYCRTCGLIEGTFTVNDTQLSVFDTGGQRKERRKWIQLFETVHCVVVAVSLSHFDRTLVEDGRVNALRESVDLFEELMKCKYLRRSPFVLLFTHSNLFEHKIRDRHKSLSECFADYRDVGDRSLLLAVSYLRQISWSVNIPPLLTRLCAEYFGGEVQSAMDFVIAKFKAKIPEQRMGSVHIHTICALKTDEVQAVFDEIPNLMIPPQSTQSTSERVHSKQHSNSIWITTYVIIMCP